MNEWSINLLWGEVEIFASGMLWFILYLLYKCLFPWKTIIIFSVVLLILSSPNDRDLVYMTLWAIMLGSGMAGFFLYLKELYSRLKQKKISFKLVFPLILYMFFCWAVLGVRQH